MIYKLLLALLFITVSAQIFDSNILDYLNIDQSLLSEYMQSFALKISGFLDITNLIFIDGTFLLAFKLVLLILYWFLIYKLFIKIIHLLS